MHHGLQRPKVPGRVVLLDQGSKKKYSSARGKMQFNNLIKAESLGAAVGNLMGPKTGFSFEKL